MTNQQELERVGYKTGGHLPGGVYKHKTTGEKFLLKIPNNQENAENEIFAAKLYQLLDVKTANLKLIEFNSKTAIISEWIENYVDLGDNLVPTNANGLFENFAIDAWLSHRDVVGTENNNIGFIGNEAIRIDLGGSLFYRGMGALNGKLFAPHVLEVCSMLDFTENYNSAPVFKYTTVKHFIDGVTKIKLLGDKEIETLVIEHAPGDHWQKSNLLSHLLARRDDLVIKATQLENTNIDNFLKAELCGIENNSPAEL